MAAVLALLNYVVSVLLSLLGLTQSRADQITVNKILAILTDPVVGLNALHGELTTVLADLSSIQGDVLALGAPQQSGSPVTLPTVPPTGYGGLDATATGNAVWDAVSADEATTFGTIAAALSVYLRTVRDSLAFEQRIGERFLINFDPFGLVNNANTSYPSHSAAEILTTDSSLLDFLQRIEPTWDWQLLGDGTYWAEQPGTAGGALMYCTLTPGEFAWYKATNGGKLLVPGVPPVWPGLANITYLTPVEGTSPGGDTTVDCDGVKFELDAVPNWAGKFDFGGITSWRNVGAISFKNDEGTEEFPQTLGFEHAFILCKQQTRAAGFCWRLAGGYHGWFTPFTINS